MRRNRPVEVYRPLRRGDITSDLLGKEVHILWPDNGVWYRAILNEVHIDPFLALAAPLHCTIVIELAVLRIACWRALLLTITRILDIPGTSSDDTCRHIR